MSKNKFFLVLLFWLSIMFFALFLIEKVNIAKISHENKMLNKAINESFEKFVLYMDGCSDISVGCLKEYVFPVRNVLIYRFKDDMCDECIDQDLGELYNFQCKVGKKCILILPAYKKNRGNDIFLSNRLDHFVYKNISDSIIGFPLNQKTGQFIRYLAYIGEDGKISSIFFPIKFEQQLTQIYLHVLESRLQRGNSTNNDK